MAWRVALHLAVVLGPMMVAGCRHDECACLVVAQPCGWVGPAAICGIDCNGEVAWSFEVSERMEDTGGE